MKILPSSPLSTGRQVFHTLNPVGMGFKQGLQGSLVEIDLKAQQELLRHADVRTTLNIYTQAVPSALREANSKVVRLVIPAQVA